MASAAEDVDFRGYTPRSEREALKAVDVVRLDKLIDYLIYEGRAGTSHRLGLAECGQFVRSNLHAFERALSEYSKAKSNKKREETKCTLRRAGSNLMHAVQQMRDRVKQEEKEAELFLIDDRVIPPSRFSEKLTVRIAYRWRPAVEADWTNGSITYAYDPKLDDLLSILARKPSPTKQERERQERLYREWEYLRISALCSIRDFFKDGGDGAVIPKTFQIRNDPHGQGLNNHSTKFWLEPPPEQ
ncbi:hypothetical protein DZ977_006295 [Pseudomonas aeruginosa]|nr:hypothetical protein [Pseudomonas aeruginosa]